MLRAYDRPRSVLSTRHIHNIGAKKAREEIVCGNSLSLAQKEEENELVYLQ